MRAALFETLRVRVTLWYALVLSLVLSLFGGLLYGMVRYQLVRHHDTTLTKVAATVVRVLAEHEDCARLTSEQRAQLDRIGHLVLFHEIEGERQVFYRSPESDTVTAFIEGYRGSGLGEGRFDTIPGPRGLLRMYSEPYRSRIGRHGVIHVLEHLGDVPAPLASLRLALLLMAPLAVLLSATGGYWLAGRALSPVDEVTRMAREIEADRLSRRLPVPRAHDEIGRLVETINQMLARLEEAFEAMRRFTADASHELRGPLTTMRGAIDVALSRPRHAEEYRQALVSVGEDVDRLRSISEDLLVLARADAGRVNLERRLVRLDVVAAEVAESLRAAAATQVVSIEARCTEAAVVRGDERWLRQLVLNLLDNAVKFSASSQADGSTALVSLGVSTSDGAVRLEVDDSGPGIPEESLGRIFERFYRANAARPYQQTQGFGLGLSIASWIVEAHGAKITAENRLAGGSRFTVTFARTGTGLIGASSSQGRA